MYKPVHLHTNTRSISKFTIVESVEDIYFGAHSIKGHYHVLGVVTKVKIQ